MQNSFWVLEGLVPSENLCLTHAVPSHISWLGVSFLAVWVAACSISSVRQAFLNGWRCLARHALIWKIPAAFATIYGIFQSAVYFLQHARLERWPDWQLPPLPDSIAIGDVLIPSLLPAAEMLAADLNCLVATFPVSALFGVLFLFNHRALASELRKSLCRQFGGWGWLLFGALAICALCSVLKPASLLALPELAAVFPAYELILMAGVINALSFVFEYLLGTCFQIYLLLLAYGWMRGLHFSNSRLLHFSVRRLGFVLKWALVIVGLTLLFIQLPLIAEAGLAQESGAWGIFGFVDDVARPLLALLMLGLGTVQIHLALHNDSLRGALRAHAAFFRRHGIALVVFLLAGFSLPLALLMIQTAGLLWLGMTPWAQIWVVLMSAGVAMTGGWILASWVCFYKNQEGRARAIAF